MRISLVVCKCTAEGASREQTHSSGGQPESIGWHLVYMQPLSPKLAASMIPKLWWGWRESNMKGLRQLASVNTNICRAKPAMLVIGFISSEIH